MSNITIRINQNPFLRGDLGMVVPDDGHTYVMVQHEWILWGKTRHSDNDPKSKGARPAVANKDWGIVTENAGNAYHEVNEPWQWFFLNFWDAQSGGLLPMGEHIGQYTNPMNPNVIYDQYTPGSKLELYARMIDDAVAFTDAQSPTNGAKDYVTRRNMISRFLWSWLKGRPTTGAILQVGAKLGTKLRINCLDFNLDPPDPWKLEFWQYFYCTQVHIDGRVTRFPQVKNQFEVHGWDPVGTTAPLVSPGGYFLIDKDKCVELQPGTIWQPYLETV